MKKPIDTYLKIQDLKQHPHKKPIFYWLAISKYTGKALDQNTNIAILKAQYGDSCNYKPIS